MVDIEKEYQLEYFKQHGFIRKQCSSCGAYFWALDPNQKICNDSPCSEYMFIGNPLIKKEYSVHEMREAFLSFFERRGHTRIDPYPVVARWREDVYLTIASIADFQPHVTSGEVTPPANPLTISQPCIRLTDIDSVGKSGRHLTTFEMMAHHAFNTKDKTIYWKDETVDYCTKLLNEFGIKTSEITYKEKAWAGGGNAGPAFEVIVGGLELATLVFMNLVRDDDGKTEIEGEKYSPIPLKIVDTGYGLERFVWASKNAPTIYDAIYPNIISKLTELANITHDLQDERYFAILERNAQMSGAIDLNLSSSVAGLRNQVVKRLNEKNYNVTADELAKILSPLENIYAIADHTRCLTLMLADGIVPSNVKAGYLARLVMRKILKLMNEARITVPLTEIMALHVKDLSADFPRVREMERIIMDIIESEQAKYEQTISKGILLIQREISKKKNASIPLERLMYFYDTHGLPPEIIKKATEAYEVSVEVPEDFYALVANAHSKAEVEKTVEQKKLDLPVTKVLFYDRPDQIEFDAVVLYSDGKKVALDQTAFYPEMGGQAADHGALLTPDDSIHVTDVQKVGNVIVHTVDRPIPVGTVVHGRVNLTRRTNLMRMHTGTHIINGSCREILAKQIWQAGAEKVEEKARLDISHYKKISEDELKRIELRANEIVMQNLPVTIQWYDRNEAQKKFGFLIYQGGVPAGEKVRVIQIADFDVEACGGTHCSKTGDIGLIKIIRSEQIQDGVQRIEFTTGVEAIRHVQMQDSLLQESATTLRVTPDKLPATIKDFFADWKQRGKKIESLIKTTAMLKKEKLLEKPEKIGNVNVIVEIGKDEMQDMIYLATVLTQEKNTIAIIASDANGGKIVLASHRSLHIDCSEIIKEAARILGGSGGGKKTLAQGGGPLGGSINEAIRFCKKSIKDKLAKDGE